MGWGARMCGWLFYAISHGFSFLLFPFHAVARCIVRGSERRALTCIPSQTHPSTQSVQLIGSWDNFSQSYPMQRDVRRGRGQWRGCYSFRDIVCDDASVSASATCVGTSAGTGTGFGSPSGSCLNKRHGGLKMGHTYYYYVCHPTLACVCHSVSSYHPYPITNINTHSIPCILTNNNHPPLPFIYIYTRLPNPPRTFTQPLHSFSCLPNSVTPSQHYNNSNNGLSV